MSNQRPRAALHVAQHVFLQHALFLLPSFSSSAITSASVWPQTLLPGAQGSHEVGHGCARAFVVTFRFPLRYPGTFLLVQSC